MEIFNSGLNNKIKVYTNIKYSVLLKNNIYYLCLNYLINPEKLFSNTSFFQYYSLEEIFPNQTYTVNSKTNNNLSENDIKTINSYEPDTSLYSIQVHSTTKLVYPRVWSRYYKNLKLIETTFNMITTDTEIFIYWKINNSIYLYILKTNWTNLTNELDTNFIKNQEKNIKSIVIANKEYTNKKFKEKFICRHDWQRILKKSRIIIITFN